MFVQVTAWYCDCFWSFGLFCCLAKNFHPYARRPGTSVPLSTTSYATVFTMPCSVMIFHKFLEKVTIAKALNLKAVRSTSRQFFWALITRLICTIQSTNSTITTAYFGKRWTFTIWHRPLTLWPWTHVTYCTVPQVHTGIGLIFTTFKV